MNTAAKRTSMLNLALPWRMLPPVNNATAALDRVFSLLLYIGLLVGDVISPPKATETGPFGDNVSRVSIAAYTIHRQRGPKIATEEDERNIVLMDRLQLANEAKQAVVIAESERKIASYSRIAGVQRNLYLKKVRGE